MNSRLIAAITCLSLAAAASANDGGISYGGAPRLLSGHPSVSMESEVINMTVGKKSTTVDCRFVFRNHGPACTVRMGFPDQGEGANDPDEEHSDDYASRPAVTLFHSFRSWVDGSEVRTKLIRSNESGLFWHAKTVRFPANGAHIVRDLYTVDIGGGIVGVAHQKSVFGAETSYTLHTGASWHGPIGRSEVNVRFARPDITPPLSLGTRFDSEIANTSAHVIRYAGPCKPTVDGTTLRFVRTNWRPRDADDIYLAFAMRRYGGQ